MMDERYRTIRAKIIKFYGSNFNFCKAINEHESSVSKILRGRKDLSEEGKKKWADALNCSVKEIFG